MMKDQDVYLCIGCTAVFQCAAHHRCVPVHCIPLHLTGLLCVLCRILNLATRLVGTLIPIHREHDTCVSEIGADNATGVITANETCTAKFAEANNDEIGPEQVS